MFEDEDAMVAQVSADGNPLVTAFFSCISCSTAARRDVLSLICSVSALRAEVALSSNAGFSMRAWPPSILRKLRL